MINPLPNPALDTFQNSISVATNCYWWQIEFSAFFDLFVETLDGNYFSMDPAPAIYIDDVPVSPVATYPPEAGASTVAYVYNYKYSCAVCSPDVFYTQDIQIKNATESFNVGALLNSLALYSGVGDIGQNIVSLSITRGYFEPYREML